MQDGKRGFVELTCAHMTQGTAYRIARSRQIQVVESIRDRAIPKTGRLNHLLAATYGKDVDRAETFDNRRFFRMSTQHHSARTGGDE